MDDRTGELYSEEELAELPPHVRARCRPVDVSLLTAGAKSRGRVGRNEGCPCGSGKKFKKCCQLESRLREAEAIRALYTPPPPEAARVAEPEPVNGLPRTRRGPLHALVAASALMATMPNVVAIPGQRPKPRSYRA